MSSHLPSLFEAQKSFPIRPAWKERDRDSLVLVSPLDIDSVTINGLQFRATAVRTRPDESVTFQLEYFPVRRSPKGGPLARVEWRPLRPHNNKMAGPVEYRNVLQKGSHIHGFRLNWDHNNSIIHKGQLPLAIPLEPEPSYDEVLAFVGKAFRNSNIEWALPPPWVGMLF